MFKINKDNLDEDLSDDDSQVYYFVLEFKFKVPVTYVGDEVWSIQDYTHEYIDATEPGTDDKDAVSACPNERKNRLTTIKFKPHHVILRTGSEPEANDIRRLGDQDLYGTLMMLAKNLPQVVQIWFNWRTHTAVEAVSLRYLRNIFEQSLPPHLRTGSTLPIAEKEENVGKQPQQPASKGKKDKPKIKKPQQTSSKGKEDKPKTKKSEQRASEGKNTKPKRKRSYRPRGAPHGGSGVSSGRVTKAR